MKTDDNSILWSPTRAVSFVGLIGGIAITIGVFVLFSGSPTFRIPVDHQILEPVVDVIATPGLVVLRVFHYQESYREGLPWGMFVVCTLVNGALGAFSGFLVMDTGKLLTADFEATRIRSRVSTARCRAMSRREVRIVSVWGFVIGCGLTAAFALAPLIAFGGVTSYYPVLLRVLCAPASVVFGILGVEVPRTVVIWSSLINGVILAWLGPLAVWCWRWRIIRRSALS